LLEDEVLFGADITYRFYVSSVILKQFVTICIIGIVFITRTTALMTYMHAFLPVML